MKRTLQTISLQIENVEYRQSSITTITIPDGLNWAADPEPNDPDIKTYWTVIKKSQIPNVHEIIVKGFDDYAMIKISRIFQHQYFEERLVSGSDIMAPFNLGKFVWYYVSRDLKLDGLMRLGTVDHPEHCLGTLLMINPMNNTMAQMEVREIDLTGLTNCMGVWKRCAIRKGNDIWNKIYNYIIQISLFKPVPPPDLIYSINSSDADKLSQNVQDFMNQFT